MKKRVKQIVSVMLITMMALQVLPMSVFTANAAEVTAGATWKDTTTGIVYEYDDDISEYREKTEGAYLKHPTKPGYVFAGWWTEGSVSSATGISGSAEAISVDKTDEGAWAKFVPEDVLTVKAQTSMKVSDALDAEGAVIDGKLTANKGDGIKLRLVTSVDDSDKYAEIGFKVKINSEQKIATKKFFEELTVTEAEGASKIYPKDAFDANSSAEFAVLVIGGFKTVANINETALNVTPYWITLDGTIVDGTNRAQLLASDERANDADGSKLGESEDFDVTSGIYEYNKTLVSDGDGDGTSYKYFVGASDTVYLETKYTTAGAGNHFGITIRNGGETRQVYFDNYGVKVLANSKKTSGLVDYPDAPDTYNVMQSDGGVYVWAQKNGSSDKSSTIKTMLSSAGTDHTVIWAIEKNVLYCSVDGHIVLRMPMEKLCNKWQAGRYYQLGVAAYNDASTASQLNVTQEDLIFGKDAKEKLTPEEKELSKNEMTYEPITGSYLASSTNQSVADFTVDHVTGTGGVSANIELTTTGDRGQYAYFGVYVGFGGSTHQFYVQGDNVATFYQERYLDATNKLKNHVLNLGIKPVENGTSEVTAMVQDGYLYIYYNGNPAYRVNLQTLYPSFDKNNDTLTMGFCCRAMHGGLMYFKNVKSMTQSEIQAMKELRFYSETFSNVSSVDFANGTIANKGKQSTATRVDFMGESDRWEVTGTMYVDEGVTTGKMYPQFFVTNGSTTFSPNLCYKGFQIGSSDYNYTNATDSNSKNGALTFNKADTVTDKFVNEKPTEHDNARTKFEMDFKVVIANDVMYVWFESDTEEGKLIPSWRLPLTTSIYDKNGANVLFRGFESSDTPLQYTFGLGNMANCASGGYKNLEVKTGSDVETACIFASPEFLIKSENSNYDVANDGTITYTGTVDSSLELIAPVGANDDVYVEAVLKKGTDFNMDSLRYGFTFGKVYLNVASDSRGMMLQITDFDKYRKCFLTEEDVQAFEGDGLKIGAARISGNFYMFIERDGSMELVEMDSPANDFSSYANSSFDIKLVTYQSAKGAVYSNLKWEKGSQVNKLLTYYTPTSVTLTLYDAKNSVYGLTFNTVKKPISPIVEIKKQGENSWQQYSLTTEDFSTFYTSKTTFELEPDTTYIYRVRETGIVKSNGEAISTPDITLKTKNPNASSFTFVHVSDTQAGPQYFKQVLACVTDRADFLVHTGDLTNNVKSQEYMEMLDGNQEYLTRIPMMVLSGNHDAYGTDEIYEHFNYNIPTQDSTALGYYYSFTYGDVKFIMLNTNDLEANNELESDQYNWLIQQLEDNTCKWTVVSLHNPLYSTGKWGSDSSINQIALALQNQLTSIFARYGVDIVLQGHDHVITRTFPIDASGNPQTEVVEIENGVDYSVNPNGVIYVMDGTAGSQTRSPFVTNETLFKYSERSKVSSWAEYTVDGDTLTVTVKYCDGDSEKVYYQWGIKK